MLNFDVSKVPVLSQVSREMAKKQFCFNLNGLVHGKQPVFTDGIYYQLKGGKLVNCVLSKINSGLMDQVTSEQMSRNENDKFIDSSIDFPNEMFFVFAL